MKYIYWKLILAPFWFIFVNGEPSVHILAENLDQVITSTTLEWIDYNKNDKFLLRNAVVAAFQTVEEQKSNEAEVSDNETGGGNGLTPEPVFVCRAKYNSVWVSGQLRPNKNVCIISLYQKVQEAKQFSVLVSIEGSARLSWVHKDKYTLISQGAVTSGDIQRSFVARRIANSHNKTGSLSHFVGKFNPSENLGMFHVVDQNNIEIPFEDGEILVETEPISYELKNIRFDRNNKRHPKKQRLLGQAILKNEEKTFQKVDSVINYNYLYSLFWGKGHGLLTGLPFKVTLPNGTQLSGAWAIQQEEDKVELAPIERYLEAGTAVNVTVLGNYTEMEIPYSAIIVQYYKDEEKREITIRDTKRENKMLDIIAVYTPAYYLHNNTLVPTTTTTTTSTTTTSTTTAGVTTTQEVTPIVPPQPDDNKFESKKADNLQASDGKHENGVMQSDEQNSTIKDGETRESKPGSSPKQSTACLTTSILTILVVLLLT